MIEDFRKDCSKLPLKSNKCCSPWHRPQHLFVALASSIFWLSTLESFLCQSSLWEDYYNVCLSALSKWLSGRIEDFNNGATPRCLFSPPTVPLTLISWPLCHHLITQEVSFSYLQYSRYTDFRGLACFKWCPRTNASAVRWLFYRWVLGAEGRGYLSTPKYSILKSVPTKITINTESLYSPLGGSFFPQYSARGIVTRHH